MKNIIILIFLSFYCADIDGIQKRKERKEKIDLFVLSITQNRIRGNCLRKDNSTNIAYCDRRSAGLCNPNDLILTNSEKNYNVSEGNNLVKVVPSCSFSFSSAEIFTEIVSDFSAQDRAWANNKYFPIESCESIGFNSSASLINESEYIFIVSPKGRIAVSADKINNTPDSILLVTLKTLTAVKKAKTDALECLELGFSQVERELVSDLRTNKRLKELTCIMESNSTNPCPF